MNLSFSPLSLHLWNNKERVSIKDTVQGSERMQRGAWGGDGEEMGGNGGGWEKMEEAAEEMGEVIGEAGEEMGEAGEEMGEVVLLHTMKAGTGALFKTVMCSPPTSWTLMWTHR